MDDSESRLRRIVDAFKRAQQCTEPERQGLIAMLREEDSDLASHLVELLADVSARRATHASVLERLRQRHDYREESVVTLESPDAPGVEADSRLVQRLKDHGPDFARYRLEDEIGAGGQGRVLRAWDLDLRRRLAIKVMRDLDRKSKAADSRRRLSRFLEEAQVTGQLEHPGVVPVHELGLDDEGRLYFTMQLVKGRDLRQIIEWVHAGIEGWNLTRALGVIIKVCETVAFAHSKGVIHRDLKPENVMVGKFGEVYVMDWGLARVLSRSDARDIRPRATDSQSSLVETERLRTKEGEPNSPLMTADGTILGTAAYMPIEQAQGFTEKVDRRSDVHSVGAMLYHLLAGHGPYLTPGTRPSPRAVLAQVLEGPPRPLTEIDSTIPPELVAICEKAMSRQQMDRYGSTMEIAKDLEAYLGKRPVSALTRSLGYVVRLAFERNRAIALTVALASVLLVTLVGVFILHLTRAVDETNEALRENERLVDVLSAPALVREFEELFPLQAEMAGRLRSWIERADQVLSRRGRYGPREPDGVELTSALTTLEHLRPRAVENLAVAESLRHDSIERHRTDWESACAEIRRLEVYGGLDLDPQLGLVPLGRNPHSGLWEFWHLLSGTRPDVDPDLGEPVLAEENGFILVLIPGGSFSMGSPPEEAGRQPNERLHRVTLGAYFLSKYEVTQAQWLRIMGENPSGSLAGSPPIGLYVDDPNEVVTFVNPVENVSWTECMSFARRVALELPTEAQWERGCRAGTTTAFAFGEAYTVLELHENVRDRGFASRIGLGTSATWEDGFWHHAPVGSFAPNGFGLYDMHGNVEEWCLDEDVQEYPVDSDQPGDGLLQGGDSRRRAFRGGSWYLSPEFCRSSFRHFDFPRSANFTRGLRVARRIDE
jgi:formylglycine-generating enzyme required for sulfatase activity/serine/threonine protein kinase